MRDEMWPQATVEFVPYEGHAEGKSQVFLQHKNTDICVDFWCECGFQGHYDGYFCSSIKCPNCSSVWVMPATIVLREHDGTTHVHNPIIPGDDDAELDA